MTLRDDGFPGNREILERALRESTIQELHLAADPLPRGRSLLERTATAVRGFERTPAIPASTRTPGLAPPRTPGAVIASAPDIVAPRTPGVVAMSTSDVVAPRTPDVLPARTPDVVLARTADVVAPAPASGVVAPGRTPDVVVAASKDGIPSDIAEAYMRAKTEVKAILAEHLGVVIRDPETL